MKTFVAPAWRKTELSDGTFTYTPVPHPIDQLPPCLLCIEVADDTLFVTHFHPDAWQGASEIYTLSESYSHSDTMHHGVLNLKQPPQQVCKVGSCGGICDFFVSNGITYCACSPG